VPVFDPDLQIVRQFVASEPARYVPASVARSKPKDAGVAP
jgi:hypothetical protein